MIKLTHYEHHSPSRLNLFAACPSMWVYEYVLGNKQPVGAPAHRGTAVEAGIARGLADPSVAVEACVDTAKRKYDALMALNPDPRREQYRDGIPAMVRLGLPALRSYGVPSATQGLKEWRPPELKLPVIGYFDFEWDQHGIILDLKTTEKCPSEIKIAHARQVAVYAETDNRDARVAYLTPKRFEPYRLENIGQHKRAMLNIALTVERLLSLSDEPDFYKQLFVPDLDGFYWNNPVNRTIAFQHWGI